MSPGADNLRVTTLPAIGGMLMTWSFQPLVHGRDMYVPPLVHGRDICSVTCFRCSFTLSHVLEVTHL